MTGPLGRPLRAGASVIDIMGRHPSQRSRSSPHCAERDKTGKGQLVKSALF